MPFDAQVELVALSCAVDQAERDALHAGGRLKPERQRVEVGGEGAAHLDVVAAAGEVAVEPQSGLVLRVDGGVR